MLVTQNIENKLMLFSLLNVQGNKGAFMIENHFDIFLWYRTIGDIYFVPYQNVHE